MFAARSAERASNQQRVTGTGRGMTGRRKARGRTEPASSGRRVSPPPRRHQSPRAKPKRRRAPARPFVRRIVQAALIALLVVVLGLGATIMIFISRLPDPALLTLDDRPPNLTILAADRTVLAERGLRRGYVRLDRLPAY